MIPPPTTHRAFGLGMRCHFPLPELPGAPTDRVDLDVEATTEEEVRGRFSGSCDPPATHVGAVGAGDAYRIERGVESDYCIELVGQASFHLSGDGHRLRCAPRDVDGLSWRRFLLDTVLTTAAMVHGFEAFHAAAFERRGSVVALMGDEGAGKSTLLAGTLARGATFFSDDILCVSRDPSSSHFVAHPGPAVMNLAPVLPDGTPAERLGRVLASFGDECWLSVKHAAVETCSVSAFVLLERGGSRITVEHVDPSPTLLLRHSLESGRAPDRLRRRFTVCADLASEATLLRLSVASDDPVAEVVDALEDALATALPSTGSLAR